MGEHAIDWEACDVFASSAGLRSLGLKGRNGGIGGELDMVEYAR